MEKINWDDSFSSGNDEIDKQHKHIVELMNQLIDQVGMHSNTDEISLLLSDLMDSAVAHFHYEERYMKSIGHADLKTHKNKHEEILADLTESLMPFIEHKKDATLNIVEQLHDWITGHILEEDTKYFLP